MLLTSLKSFPNNVLILNDLNLIKISISNFIKKKLPYRKLYAHKKNTTFYKKSIFTLIKVKLK